MSIWNIVLPASIAGLAAFGMAKVKSPRRSDADLVVALKQIHDLFPYVNSELMDDITLWYEVIGGVRGMRRMLRGRFAMMLTSRDLAPAVGWWWFTPNAINGLWKDILLCGVVLWWIGWACILIEVPVQAILRRFRLGRLPRIGALSAVKLYCEMGTSLTLITGAVPSIQEDEQCTSY